MLPRRGSVVTGGALPTPGRGGKDTFPVMQSGQCPISSWVFKN